MNQYRLIFKGVERGNLPPRKSIKEHNVLRIAMDRDEAVRSLNLSYYFVSILNVKYVGKVKI